jgi:glycosyltransferase involved in cell wall biosynthesis
VGQISEEKGHALLIEALKIVKGRDRCLDVLAFGSGNSRYIAMLSEKLNTYGLTSCWHWKGYESNAEKIYEQFDMCVMPSSNESFGMVAVEASAHELPIIASNRGGLREIVEEGVTGFLIDPDDPNELSEKICWLLDNPEAARRFGVEGRKRVFREFTQEQMVAGYESLFRRSLDRP